MTPTDRQTLQRTLLMAIGARECHFWTCSVLSEGVTPHSFTCC